MNSKVLTTSLTNGIRFLLRRSGMLSIPKIPPPPPPLQRERDTALMTDFRY